MCHQSGGLVQREIEAAGIPTISLTNHPSATARIRPPRAVHVRFPRGSMFGEPGNRAKHLTVLRETFDALERMEVPGSSVVLGHRWEAPPVMWRGKGLVEGSSS